MKLPTSDHPHINLLCQREFTDSEAANFIIITSGLQLEESNQYRVDILESLHNSLKPDIDTTVYKRAVIDDEVVMSRVDGETLYSRRIIQAWMRDNSIDVADEYKKSRYQGIESNYWLNSTYLSIDALERLSKKVSLRLVELVQIIHLDKRPANLMTPEMDETGDTMFRLLEYNFDPPPDDNSLYETCEVLTLTAHVPYPIPWLLVEKVDLPIEGINWTSKPLDTGEKIGKLEPSNDSPHPTIKSNSLPRRRIIQRAEEIGLAAKETYDDPLAIPYGGKSNLRNMLCAQNPSLFTIDTFNKAWIEAKRLGLIEIENVEQYKLGK